MVEISTSQWQQVQNWLAETVGENNYKSWLQPLKPDTANSTENTLTFIVPTRFMRDWVVRHYTDTLKQGLAAVLHQQVDVTYVVRPPLSEMAAAVSATPAATPQAQTASAPRTTIVSGDVNSKPDSVSALNKSNPLDPRYTFENFVVGKSNEFAYQAAQRVADSMIENGEPAYNPFFLYGGVGLGKTHLMQAIAWEIHRKSPKRKVLYISAEKFLYQFVRSIRDKTVTHFKETFRSVDVLMIDDIQFIAGKDATQEEFFHTFDALVNERKQIILTADRSPHEMSNIEDRLRSRLGWGLATEIHTPSIETRLAIIEKKTASLGVELNRDVAMFLADKISSNIRELEGALNRLVAHSTLVQSPITIASAQDILKDLFRVYSRMVTIEEIQQRTADFYHIKLSDLNGSRRLRAVARPRQIAMYLCKQLTSKSFPDIGKSFGGRDHTTVIHACKQIEKLMQTDSAMAEDVDVLTKMLSSQQYS